MKDYTVDQKMELLADILDVEATDLKPETKLSELDWDSLVSLSYIAMMEEEFGKEVKGSQIKNFVTIQDAIDLMEG